MAVEFKDGREMTVSEAMAVIAAAVVEAADVSLGEDAEPVDVMLQDAQVGPASVELRPVELVIAYHVLRALLRT